MIIYGYKNREVVLASGQFICPKCDTDREYKHVNIVRYFTLFFFIQLFPLGKVASYIECMTCHRTFNPDEMVMSRGNEKLVADMAARKAAADLETQGVRGRNLIVLASIIGVIALCFLSILGAFALTNDASPFEENVITALIFSAMCPLPLLAVAGGLAWWGVRNRQAYSKGKTETASLMV